MKKIFICFLLSILLLSSFYVPAYAFNDSFEFEEINPSQQDDVLKSIRFRTLEDAEIKGRFSRFALKKNGSFAIGYNHSRDIPANNKQVDIYDSNGRYSFSISFYTSGNFGIDFIEDNIAIYIIRRNLVVSISANGEFLEVRKIPSSELANDAYYTLFSHRRNLLGEEYRMVSEDSFGLIIGKYDKLIKYDMDGNSEIIYEAQEEAAINDYIILFIILFCLFFVAVGIITRLSICHWKKKAGCTQQQ